MCPLPKNANANKLDDDELLGDDENLDELLAGLDDAIKSGNQKKLGKAVESMLDEDARAPHEHEDDEDEAPARRKKKGKAAKAAAEPEDDDEEGEGDAAGDDDADGDETPGDAGKKSGAKIGDKGDDSDEEDDEDDADEGDDEQGRQPDGKKAAAGGKAGSAAIKALKAFGYQVGDEIDEDTAADLLVQHHERVAAAAKNNDHLIGLGQKLLANPELLARLTGVKTDDQEGGGKVAKTGDGDDLVSKLDTRNKGLTKLKGLGEQLKALKNRPEYDPSWEASGVTFNGRMWVAPANNPNLQGTADKLNTHMKWQRQFIETAPTAMPDLVEAIEEALAEQNSSPQGLSIDQVKKLLAEERGSSARDAVAFEIAQKHAGWMFVKDGAGNLVRDPAGQPVYTKMGQKYETFFEMLHKQGMRYDTADGLRNMSNIAIALVGKELGPGGDSGGKNSSGKKNTAGVDDTKATGKKHSNADELDDDNADQDAERQRRLKARRKELAAGKSGGKAGIAGGGRRGEDDSDESANARKKPVNELKSLERMFAKGLADAGITDSNVTFGEGFGDDD